MKIAVFILLSVLSAIVFADGGVDGRSDNGFRTVSTDAVITEYSRMKSKKVFLDPRVPDSLHVYGNSDNRFTEDEILVLLDMWGFTMQESDRYVKVIPLQNLKQEGVRIVQPKVGLKIQRYEMVTTLVPLKKANAMSLIPVLRPLAPSYAHMAAVDGSNSIVITDHYANVERMIALLENIDSSWDDSRLEPVEQQALTSSDKRPDSI